MINNVPSYKRSRKYIDLPFWDRVDPQIEPIPESGCHIFTGGKVGKGYGIAHDHGKHRLIHRASWERANGPIPDGMLVLHRCDVPACVNPNHLFLGTALDNNRDREKKGRGNQRSGADHPRPNAKLNFEMVAEIKKILREDKSYGIGRRLAKKFGIGETIIYAINAGRIWKHVP